MYRVDTIEIKKWVDGGMEELIEVGVLITIFVVLYKKGLIRFTVNTYGKYVMKRSQDHVDVSYKKFDGIEYYYFDLSKGHRFTLTYSVVVERGTITIELRSMKGEFFSKSFSSSETGEFSFEAESNKLSVKLIGVETKGGCKITIK
jgi:hypothetical protein